jgi:diguanylate cyclase (GGDEF)-like protein
MLGYPLKMIFASLMLCTVFQYVEKKFPKGLLFVLGGLVLADFVFAVSNSLTQALLELSVHDLNTFNDLYTASHGPIFIYHLVITYVIALSAIVLLFVFLAKKQGIRQYKSVTKMMALSVFFVLLFNSLQLFVFEINIDLTYISLVIVAYSLYDAIYRQDMIFNLRTSGRSEILANMRELYILTDDQKRVIEISPLLLEKYHLSESEIIGNPFSFIIEKLSDQVSFYESLHIEEDDATEKDRYHLREKEFQLQGIREKGHMILLYDETQVYVLLRELNRLSNFDAMTGLNNRNYIEHKLTSITDTKHLGVFSIDLNGLKTNNDYLGHERGDYLLKSVATKLKQCFKQVKEKEIARIGGDEFLVITHHLSPLEMEKYMSDLIKITENDDIMQEISISVGLACDQSGIKNIYQLIKEADDQMYHMKAITSKNYQERLIDYIKMQDKYIR